MYTALDEVGENSLTVSAIFAVAVLDFSVSRWQRGYQEFVVVVYFPAARYPRIESRLPG